MTSTRVNMNQVGSGPTSGWCVKTTPNPVRGRVGVWPGHREEESAHRHPESPAHPRQERGSRQRDATHFVSKRRPQLGQNRPT